MTPRRIQRKRTRGWRMPEGTIYVGRPSYWGNPFIVDRSRSKFENVQQTAVDRYRSYLETSCVGADARRYLRGHDLACWCPLDEPCHADVLLEIANAR